MVAPVVSCLGECTGIVVQALVYQLRQLRERFSEDQCFVVRDMYLTQRLNDDGVALASA
jgi:hypothetical protein